MEEKYNKEITEINALIEQLKDKAFELHEKLAAETELVMPKYVEWKTIRKELEEEENYGKDFEKADDECLRFWRKINDIDNIDESYGIELVSALEDIEIEIEERRMDREEYKF